jgi:hypothetical protein
VGAQLIIVGLPGTFLSAPFCDPRTRRSRLPDLAESAPVDVISFGFIRCSDCSIFHVISCFPTDDDKAEKTLLSPRERASIVDFLSFFSFVAASSIARVIGGVIHPTSDLEEGLLGFGDLTGGFFRRILRRGDRTDEVDVAANDAVDRFKLVFDLMSVLLVSPASVRISRLDATSLLLCVLSLPSLPVESSDGATTD